MQKIIDQIFIYFLKRFFMRRSATVRRIVFWPTEVKEGPNARGQSSGVVLTRFFEYLSKIQILFLTIQPGELGSVDRSVARLLCACAEGGIHPPVSTVTQRPASRICAASSLPFDAATLLHLVFEVIVHLLRVPSWSPPHPPVTRRPRMVYWQ